MYSPLKRAQETMEIINNIVKIESFCESLLIEQDYGLFESLTIEEQKSQYLNLYNQFESVKNQFMGDFMQNIQMENHQKMFVKDYHI